MFSLQSITLEHMNTFHHNNHTSSSRIDHILYFIPQAKNINIEFRENLCKLNDASNLSSHDVIMGKISFQVMRAHTSEIDYKHTYTSFEVCKPQWNMSSLSEYQAESYMKLKYLADTFNEPEHIPVLSELCSTVLVKTAESVFPSKPKLKKPDRAFLSKTH